METWKDVVGYEGLYQVSDAGRVRSLDRVDRFGRTHVGRILRPTVQRNGYIFVNLSDRGRQKHALIHRLVAECFVENVHCFNEVNHINEDKADNSASNLEWCVHKYNMNYGTARARTAKAQGRKVHKLSLDGEVLNESESVRAAARAIGHNHKDIYNVCNGLRPTAGGYKWAYAEPRV